MIEYIDGPCGWTRAAPTYLRRNAPHGASKWHNYSTARFLTGLDPIIVRTVRFADLEIDSGIQIELLPEALFDMLSKGGLKLATEEDMNETGFHGVLSNALSLVRIVPPLLGTVTGLCRSLHVLVATGIEFDSSYSDPTLPFSIFVSCPPPTALNRVERLAENIVHEALHLQLSLVEAAEPLVLENQEETCLFSPWKNEPRTVHGILHGVYVFGNLRYFWNFVAGSTPQYSAFAERRIEEIDRELATVSQFPTNSALSAMGQQLAKSLLHSRPEAR